MTLERTPKCYFFSKKGVLCRRIDEKRVVVIETGNIVDYPVNGNSDSLCLAPNEIPNITEGPGWWNQLRDDIQHCHRLPELKRTRKNRVRAHKDGPFVEDDEDDDDNTIDE